MRALAFDTEPFFDLFGTEPAEHHCPVCTMPATDFETNQNRLLWNQKLTWKYCHPEETNKMKLPPSFACFKIHLLKLPPQRTTHEPEFPRIHKSTKSGFGFGF